jgi:MFS family permease
MFLASFNGLLWAVGSGLLGSQLVVYLAQEFHSERIGLGVGMILAAPYFVGVLRLAVPAMMARLANRKQFCIACFLASGLVLTGIPLLAAMAAKVVAWAGIATLVVLWCGYNLLEYLGLVGLWSWLADIAPQRIRGRFFGRRESWMAAGQAAAMLASAGLIALWERVHPGQAKGLAYALSGGLGSLFVIAAAVPLWFIPACRAGFQPATPSGRLETCPTVWPQIVVPLGDRRFLRLLLAGLWFSFTNGLIQSPQSLFPNRVLGLSLSFMLAMKVGLRCGQWPIAPSVGKLADIFGNRAVMFVSLVFVAMGPLFYSFATKAHYGWIIAAWVCWIGWVGYNIGLPNLLLKVAPRSLSSSYVALYYAAIGLAHGGGSFLGGVLFDRFGKMVFTISLGDRIPLGYALHDLSYYQLSFVGGAVAYLISAMLVLVVVREE